MAKKQLARRVAYVEQHGMTEANMRVRDVVRLGRIPHHSPFSNWSAQDDEAIAAALQRVAMLEKSELGGCISPARWRRARAKSCWMSRPTIWIYTIRCS